MKENIKKCLLAIIFAVLASAAAKPETVMAAEASVTFGSESYEALENENFPIGVYIESETSYGDYYIEVQYDNSRLEYIRGGNREEDGIIILEGGGQRNSLKYMLEFRSISGGTARIRVKEARIYASGAEDGEPLEVLTLSNVPIEIAGEDNGESLEDWDDEAESGENDGEGDFPDTDIPLLGRTFLEEQKYYIVDLSKYLPQEVDWDGQKVTGLYEGQLVTYLTNESQQMRFLYLMDAQEGVGLYAYSQEREQLYPCNTFLLDGDKYYIMSPYVCEEWPQGLTRDIIQSESIVYAMNLEGQCSFYKITSGNKLLPWDSKEGENTLYQQTVKLIAIFGIAVVIMTAALLFALHLDREKKRRRRKTEKRLEELLQIRDLNRSMEVEEILAQQENTGFLEAELEETEPPVILAENVTMRFKVAMSNVSGIKEYIIQLLKKQISYRELLALDNVSFRIYKGEVVGIIGTNGSGKSTLVKIVSGALKPTSGRIVADHKKVQLLTLGTGFDMELTAKENVYLNGSIIGYTKEFLDEKYDEIVAFAELDGFMEEKVKNFSSGMISRLGFAIATAGDAAEILILDEVLSVGDEFFRKKSLKRVNEMIHGGSTVLIVSHSLGSIVENCSKAVWIEKGKLRMVGEPKKVCEAYRRMNG